ncbi:HDOD domain-containing protein [Aquifex pyrophilus]
MSFAIARQPIYDREGNLFAYEVYLRKSDEPDKYPSEVPFSRATYIITNILLEHGFDKVSGGKKLVINVSFESLLNKSLELLPLDKVIFDINPPDVPIGETVYKKVLEKVKDFKRSGVLFILHPKLYTSNYKDLIALVHIIEFFKDDVSKEKISGAKRNGKKVLVSMIENEEEYKSFYEWGADYFEGYYLGKPEVILNVELAPFLKVTLFRLMNALTHAKSLKEIADVIGSDVGMAVKFLKFVNSAYFARRKKIEDLQHAVAYVGLENVKKFVLLIALNEYMKLEHPELWKRSLIRAHIAEELMNKSSPQMAEKAFLVGLFSLLDKILGVDIPSFLEELNVDEEVVNAFRDENAPLRKVLDIATRLEEALNKGPEELDRVASELSLEMGIPEIDLILLTKDAEEKARNLLKI